VRKEDDIVQNGRFVIRFDSGLTIIVWIELIKLPQHGFV